MIKIGNYTINKNSAPFIIAEAGINHNGELDKAYKMITVAKNAGADAIKFQIYKAEEFIKDPNQLYTYTSQGRIITESMLTMFKKYEFSSEEWHLIKKKCDEDNIIFFATPQNISDLKLLLTIGIDVIKVGSDDLVNLPLLKEYSKTKLPIILSCGMAHLSEIYEALSIVGALDGYPVILLICTSQYPTPPEDVNLLKLITLKKTFPDLIFGFSDHTQNTIASTMAIAMGALVFEKHFTLDHALEGPDHWFSANMSELKDWIMAIKTAYDMMGDSIIRPTKKELIDRNKFHRVLVASKDIKKGDIFERHCFTMKRNTFGGIPSKFLEYLIGVKAKQDIIKGDIISL